MNEFKKLLLFSIFLFPGILSAQEVFETHEGSYSTKKLTKKLEINSKNSLLIRAASNLPGKITLTTSSVKEVAIVYFKKAKASSKEQAVDFIDLIAVELDNTPNAVRLEMRAPNPAPWEGDTDWGMVEAEIIVPEKCFVEIEAALFDVEAIGPFRGIIIPASLGKIDISHVLEKLEVAASNRRVNVSDISGEITVSTSNSVLSAHNLVAIGARAQIENDHGDIRIDGFTGEINVENSYGRINISSFNVRGKRNVIRGMSGPISLEITEINDALLRVTNRFEDVELTLPENASASLSLAVDEGGKIEVSNMNVKPELIEQNRMNLVAGKGTSVVTGSVRGSGNIYVRGSHD